MGKPKSPKAPDPKETAAAQTGTNVTTALANAQLGNVNQYGPDGSVTYSTNGSKSFTDPTSGATYNIPQYTQTTTLSPQQQAIKAQTDAASLNLGTLANNQSGFLKDYLAKPVSLDTSATEARTMDLANQRLAPQIAQRDEDLRTRLANQGIKAGSDAYDRELNTFNQGTNDAYNQLFFRATGRPCLTSWRSVTSRLTKFRRLCRARRSERRSLAPAQTSHPCPRSIIPASSSRTIRTSLAPTIRRCSRRTASLAASLASAAN
jgi:hypothetical protein